MLGKLNEIYFHSDVCLTTTACPCPGPLGPGSEFASKNALRAERVCKNFVVPEMTEMTEMTELGGVHTALPEMTEMTEMTEMPEFKLSAISVISGFTLWVGPDRWASRAGVALLATRPYRASRALGITGGRGTCGNSVISAISGISGNPGGCQRAGVLSSVIPVISAGVLSSGNSVISGTPVVVDSNRPPSPANPNPAPHRSSRLGSSPFLNSKPHFLICISSCQESLW